MLLFKHLNPQPMGQIPFLNKVFERYPLGLADFLYEEHNKS